MSKSSDHNSRSEDTSPSGELVYEHAGLLQPGNLLIVDEDEYVRELCKEVASGLGLRSRTVSTPALAFEIIERYPIDLILIDLSAPEQAAFEVLRRLRSENSHVAVIVLTQYGTIDGAIEAMRLGASDYVTKPFHVDDLRAKLDRLVRAIELNVENRILREQLRSRPGFGGQVGVSPKMQRVYRLIEKVSQQHFPVLILGESGTGKELVARSIHYASPRRQGPFAPVDCSALVPTLIESELFGYVKGAFTGALRSKQGLFEAAQGGTLFLDEIGDLPADLQAKLLRALQEKEIKPVGSTERVPIDVRVIAATNRDLEATIRAGTFRQDLYYRLNVVQIKLPPLRERKSDIPLLVNFFLEKFGNSDGSTPLTAGGSSRDGGITTGRRARPEGSGARTIAEDAMTRLMAYDWPGNVRELENAIERAVALGSGPILHVGDLPSNLQYGSGERLPGNDELLPLEELERRAIFRALRETGGDKLAAARLLGIGKTTLYRKLKQYQIPPGS